MRTRMSIPLAKTGRTPGRHTRNLGKAREDATKVAKSQINAVAMKVKSQFAVAVAVAVNAVRKSKKSKTIARNCGV